jgi:uncharacterized delta-60 repeat protein
MEKRALSALVVTFLVGCGSSSSSTTTSQGDDGGADAAGDSSAADAGADAAPGSITLAASATEVTIVAGSTATIDVQATRGAGADGDIALTVSGLPNGVTAAAATIAAGATKATITLTAAASAAQGGPVAFTIDGAISGSHGTASSKVFVRGLPGTLDMSLGGSGIAFVASPSTQVYSVATQSDGKIVLAGTNATMMSSASNRGFVARFDGNGKADTSFGTNGATVVDFGTGVEEIFSNVAVQSDGKIVASGYTFNGGNGVAIIARVDAAGALDPSFAATGKYTASFPGTTASRVYSVVPQSDGKILGLGNVATGAGQWAFMRLTPQGGTDGTFGSGGQEVFSTRWGDAWCGVQQSDGTVVIAGTLLTTVNSTYFDSWMLTRVMGGGTVDPSFGQGGWTTTTFGASTYLSTCALDSQNRVVVAGAPLGGNGNGMSFAVGRYVNGQPDASFATNGVVQTPLGTGNGAPAAIFFDATGNIIVAGSSPIGGVTVLRYASNGMLDSSFGTGGELGTNAGLTAANARGASMDARARVIVVGNALQSGTAGVFFARVWL